MDSTRIETGADYTLKEYRDWYFFIYYGNGITGVLNTLGLIAITVIAGFILANKALSGIWHFKFIEIAMIAMDLYMFSIPAVILYDTKESFSSDKFRAENGKLLITSDSIEMSSPAGSARITWQAVKKAYITKKAVYLEYSKFNAVIIPKRMLKNEEEQDLVKLVREKVKV